VLAHRIIPASRESGSAAIAAAEVIVRRIVAETPVPLGAAADARR
jgi:hypothetical protein